jgi:hypothetical protein
MNKPLNVVSGPAGVTASEIWSEAGVGLPPRQGQSPPPPPPAPQSSAQFANRTNPSAPAADRAIQSDHPSQFTQAEPSHPAQAAEFMSAMSHWSQSGRAQSEVSAAKETRSLPNTPPQAGEGVKSTYEVTPAGGKWVDVAGVQGKVPENQFASQPLQSPQSGQIQPSVPRGQQQVADGRPQTAGFSAPSAVGQGGSGILPPSAGAGPGPGAGAGAGAGAGPGPGPVGSGLGGEGNFFSAQQPPQFQQQGSQSAEFDTPLLQPLSAVSGLGAAWDKPHAAGMVSGHVGASPDDAVGSADSAANPPAALDPWAAPVPVVPASDMQFQPLQPSTVEMQLHHSLLAQPHVQGQFELLLPQGNIGVTYDMGQDSTQVMLQGSTMSLVKQLKTMSTSLSLSLSERRGHAVSVTAI